MEVEIMLDFIKKIDVKKTGMFVAVFITLSLALRTAAVQFVYTFFASLLDKILIPAVPKATPAAKIPVFLTSIFLIKRRLIDKKYQ